MKANDDDLTNPLTFCGFRFDCFLNLVNFLTKFFYLFKIPRITYVWAAMEKGRRRMRTGKAFVPPGSFLFKELHIHVACMAGVFK